MHVTITNASAVKLMNRAYHSVAGLVLVALLLILPGLASAATYYVSSTEGDDIMGYGTSEDPWRSITKAAAMVGAGTAVSPNVIMVAAGTYDIINGETFPITFANDYVSLTGAGSGTTFIEPAAISNDSLHIDATGISVSGFTFLNNSDADAIAITEGGFNIHDNVFETMVRDGISFYLSETDRTTGISFANMSITNNTFKTTQNGIYVSLGIDFDDTVIGLTASFGDFTVTGNTFPLTSGDGIYISSLFNPQEITSGTVTVGKLTVKNNTVTGGDTGIYFWSGLTYMEDTQVTLGNMEVSNNTCTNQSSYGIYLYNWEMYHFYGTTHAELGNFTVSGNTVTAMDYATYPNTDGIYLDYMDDIGDIYEDTTIATGSISVTNNTVDVDGYGIYFYSYGIWYIGGKLGTGDPLTSVTITTGPRTVTGNTLKSNGSYGLYLDLEYIGYDMYGTSSVNYGSFEISSNTITSYNESLYFDMYEAGYDMYENSRTSLGSVNISGNTLNATATGYGGMYFYFDEVAYGMYGDSTFTMNPYTIDKNTINATNNNGIDIEYYEYYVGSYMEGNSTATLPDWIITDNTIDVTGGYSGIYFYTYCNPYDMYNFATANYGSMLIDHNTFNPNKNKGMAYGIYLDYYYTGYDLYNSASSSFGDITVTDNTFYAIDDEAIYIYSYEFAYSLADSSTMTLGDIEIGNNTIDKANWGIDVYFDYIYSYSNANVVLGELNIHDNTLTGITEYGIYSYFNNYNYAPATAALTIGAPTISGNAVSGTTVPGDGIYVQVENSTGGISFGMPTISGNTVSGFDHGIYLVDLEDASLSCNFLENNTLVGMRFNTGGTNFTVKTNSLVGNGIGLSVDNGKAAVINAERNWWGDKAGPVACASCNGVNAGDSGSVDFTPWLTFQPDKARCGKPFPWLMFVPAITGMGN